MAINGTTKGHLAACARPALQNATSGAKTVSHLDACRRPERSVNSTTTSPKQSAAIAQWYTGVVDASNSASTSKSQRPSQFASALRK